MKIKITFYSILLLFIVGCSSVRFIEIEVQKPPQVYFSDDINNIVIVNNLTTQPADIGHYNYGEPIEVKSDSVSIILGQALTQYVNDERFFGKIALVSQSLKPQRLFLSDEPLAREEITEYAAHTNSDVVITLDRLILGSNLTSVITGNYMDIDYLKVKIDASLRVYNSKGNELAPKIHYNDSILWTAFRQGAYYYESLPSREDALKDATLYAADNITKLLLPHWVTVERFYYTDSSAKMKDAAIKASSNEWRDAALIWGEAYEEEDSVIKKVKLATNIALANEMLDDIENAIVWINIAQDSLNELNKSQDDELVQFTKEYKKDLSQRLLDLQIMDNQN